MKRYNQSFMFSARKQILRVPSAFVSKACSSPTRVVKLHCRRKSVRGWKIESFWLFANAFFKTYFSAKHTEKPLKDHMSLCSASCKHSAPKICCPDPPPSPLELCLLPYDALRLLFSPVSNWFAVCIAWTHLVCQCIGAGRLICWEVEMCTQLCGVDKTLCLLCQLPLNKNAEWERVKRPFASEQCLPAFCLRGKMKHVVTLHIQENLLYLEV